MRRHSARGFTLIEMLVVIAVVLVLAVLLLPWGRRPRESERVSCPSNLKQIGLALEMYAQDYDGSLPWNPAPGGLPAASWAPSFRPSDCAAEPTTSFVVMLDPYIKSRYSFLYHCPDSPGYDAARHLGYAQSLDPARANQIGYGFNELLIGSPCHPRTLSSLGHDPKEIALFADAEQPWASTAGHWVKVNGEWARCWAWDPARPPRHQSSQDVPGQNFAFADGHARFLQPVREAGSGKDDGRGYYRNARLE
jgi:prepilin-type N-terminal cleavage/methylation domain-containing protein/prepilin-type processing-associated H-X9-DG protein